MFLPVSIQIDQGKDKGIHRGQDRVVFDLAEELDKDPEVEGNDPDDHDQDEICQVGG